MPAMRKKHDMMFLAVVTTTTCSSSSSCCCYYCGSGSDKQSHDLGCKVLLLVLPSTRSGGVI
jgi:hypothetical protein